MLLAESAGKQRQENDHGTKAGNVEQNSPLRVLRRRSRRSIASSERNPGGLTVMLLRAL